MSASDPGYRHLHVAEGAQVRRDPLGKTIAETFIERHPDWTDQQIAERVNQDCGPVITCDEVAHWRAEVTR